MIACRRDRGEAGELRKKGTFRRAPESFFQSPITQKALGQRALLGTLGLGTQSA